MFKAVKFALMKQFQLAKMYKDRKEKSVKAYPSKSNNNHFSLLKVSLK